MLDSARHSFIMPSRVTQKNTGHSHSSSFPLCLWRHSICHFCHHASHRPHTSLVSHSLVIMSLRVGYSLHSGTTPTDANSYKRTCKRSSMQTNNCLGSAKGASCPKLLLLCICEPTEKFLFSFFTFLLVCVAPE